MSEINKADNTMPQVMREIFSGGLVRTVISILLGFLVGALFMIGSNKEFIESLGYIFARPGRRPRCRLRRCKRRLRSTFFEVLFITPMQKHSRKPSDR